MNDGLTPTVIGNTGWGKTQSRTVYDIDNICPTLCAGMDHGNTIPYIIVENDTICCDEEE